MDQLAVAKGLGAKRRSSAAPKNETEQAMGRISQSSNILGSHILIRESSSPSRHDGEAIAEDSEFASVSSSELDRRRRAERGTGARVVKASALADPNAYEGRLALLYQQLLLQAYPEDSSEDDEDAASCGSAVCGQMMEREDFRKVAKKMEERVQSGQDINIMFRLTAINALFKHLAKPRKHRPRHHKFTVSGQAEAKQDKVEVAFGQFFQNSQVIDSMIDRLGDNHEEIRMKQSVGEILSRSPEQRTKVDAKRLGEFFKRFKFFGELKEGHEPELFYGVMENLNSIQVNNKANIIEQGDEGDRFYVIIRGTVEVLLTKAVEVPQFMIKKNSEERIMAFLQALSDNAEDVTWSKVPFKQQIKKYLKQAREHMKSRFLPSFKLFDKSVHGDPKHSIIEALAAIKRVSSHCEDTKEASAPNPLKILGRLSKAAHGQHTQEEVLKKYKAAESIPAASLKPDLLRLGFEFPKELMRKLLLLEKVYDFSKIITTFKVAEMETGTGFGELALNNNTPRNATIRAKGKVILAYLEREVYQSQLRKANMRDNSRKMQFLKEIRFFQDLSVSKLQKMSLNMKHIKIVKNQELYHEDEEVDGIYLVMQGQMSYTKTTPYQEPLSSKTKNKWFMENTKRLGIGKKLIGRQVAVFTLSACIGYEEILREYIHCNNIGEFYTKKRLGKRDFTCICSSIDAKVMFLSHDEFVQVIRQSVDVAVIEQVFKERRSILNRVLGDITAVNDKISGQETIQVSAADISVRQESKDTSNKVEQKQDLANSNVTSLIKYQQTWSMEFSSNQVNSAMLSPNMMSSRANEFPTSQQNIRPYSNLNKATFVYGSNLLSRTQKNSIDTNDSCEKQAPAPEIMNTLTTAAIKKKFQSRANLVSDYHETGSHKNMHSHIVEIDSKSNNLSCERNASLQSNSHATRNPQKNFEPKMIQFLNKPNTTQQHVRSHSKVNQEIVHKQGIQSNDNNKLPKLSINQNKSKDINSFYTQGVNSNNSSQEKINNDSNQQNAMRITNFLQVQGVSPKNKIMSSSSRMQSCQNCKQGINDKFKKLTSNNDSIMEMNFQIDSAQFLTSWMGNTFQRQSKIDALSMKHSIEQVANSTVKGTLGILQNMEDKKRTIGQVAQISKLSSTNFMKRRGLSQMTNKTKSQYKREEQYLKDHLPDKRSLDTNMLISQYEETCIDEKSAFSKNNERKDRAPLMNSRLSASINISQMPSKHSSPPKQKEQSQKKTWHTDSNKLYIADLKNFTGLRKAAINCENRKIKENHKLRTQASPGDSGILVKQFRALKTEKYYYDGLQSINPNDRIGNELTINLMNIKQSLDTSQFLQKNETHMQHALRLNASVENNMKSIDNVFDEMDDAERNFKLSKKKRTSAKNVIDQNMKQAQASPSKRKREVSYNSTVNRTNVDFETLVHDLNRDIKHEWQYMSPQKMKQIYTKTPEHGNSATIQHHQSNQIAQQLRLQRPQIPVMKNRLKQGHKGRNPLNTIDGPSEQVSSTRGGGNLDNAASKSSKSTAQIGFILVPHNIAMKSDGHMHSDFHMVKQTSKHRVTVQLNQPQTEVKQATAEGANES